MNSQAVTGARSSRLMGSVFLVFFAATTLLSGVVAGLVWLTGEQWIAALIPVIPGVGNMESINALQVYKFDRTWSVLGASLRARADNG